MSLTVIVMKLHDNQSDGWSFIQLSSAEHAVIVYPKVGEGGVGSHRYTDLVAVDVSEESFQRLTTRSRKKAQHLPRSGGRGTNNTAPNIMDLYPQILYNPDTFLQPLVQRFLMGFKKKMCAP